MARRELSLPPASANYLCTRFDLQLHPLLRVGWLPLEATEQDRREPAELGRRQLIQQGLFDGDELHPFVEDAVRLLARPPLAVGVAVNARDGENFNAVLVEYERSTIQAYQADGDTPDDLRDIRVKRHVHGGPAGNTVNLLGAITAAEGTSVSLPHAHLEQVTQRMGGSNRTLSAALGYAGVRGAQANTLLQAFTAKRRLEGLITVRAYDQQVRRTRSLPFHAQFFATDAGCYLAQRKPGRDGQDWYTLAPADSRKLVGTINEMIRLLTRPTARV
ncbi:ESX secretion-associated protein EspG [Saccharopolyspora rhizosphaerae]|uniref:ESX secretion-associated protein EspG n=1 Tax=Saccharopolyspora rhizosphaerae TaxID=2492662 RepID=A0A426JSE3_9PSEU|nr:ESX secretion-associated protein EspG [Saccharopolyspora rhizosphaerae]RRO16115.1 ESX secretion-associated protein EspG [Saccharopolyspora rhizosphaerae]